jgi:uracil-DNA glycosylase
MRSNGVDPAEARCVILGQDRYPSPDFAIGRVFEAGSVARLRELEKLFSHRVRTFMQRASARVRCAANMQEPWAAGRA